ncbi:HK97 family phage prohead protease [Methylobacterium aquaticum]|uniref:Peptidase n=1 Tax=Methylobacterium aquaticum TaxID=270351 RepID=A0A0J6SL20_9HYPH|nr:HK97 family phage prohead protease [Methylobacterium aquaticum]KMO34317.1 peptidase [Methylobacterium aquaticum]
MTTKRVSLDEYLHAKGAYGLLRKQFARDNGVVLKAAHAESEKRAKYTKGSGRMAFVMSAEVEDRDRDIVIQAGLDTTEFEKNPVAPWAHRSGDFPVGKWENLAKNLTGRPKRTEGELALTMADPNAQRLEAHWAAGSLVACSIGFMPKEIERREVPDEMKGEYYYPGYIIHSAELYECSPCSIPANPAALAKAAADGDVLSREIIEEVLDTWKLENGILMPRKAFEDAHRDAAGGKTSHTVSLGVDTSQATADLRALGEHAEKAEGALTRLAKFFGLKPEEPAAPPVPEPQKTVEEQVRDQIAKDLPALEAIHDLFEADADLAALDAEIAVHAAL